MLDLCLKGTQVTGNLFPFSDLLPLLLTLFVCDGKVWVWDILTILLLHI